MATLWLSLHFLIDMAIFFLPLRGSSPCPSSCLSLMARWTRAFSVTIHYCHLFWYWNSSQFVSQSFPQGHCDVIVHTFVVSNTLMIVAAHSKRRVPGWLHAKEMGGRYFWKAAKKIKTRSGFSVSICYGIAYIEL